MPHLIICPLPKEFIDLFPIDFHNQFKDVRVSLGAEQTMVFMIPRDTIITLIAWTRRRSPELLRADQQLILWRSVSIMERAALADDPSLTEKVAATVRPA